MLEPQDSKTPTSKTSGVAGAACRVLKHRAHGVEGFPEIKALRVRARKSHEFIRALFQDTFRMRWCQQGNLLTRRQDQLQQIHGI